MPTNKNAMSRYQILDELLSNRYHNYNLDDLTEEVNNRMQEMDGDYIVGRRQIEKDIKYLELDGPFLADIERYDVPYTNSKTLKDGIKHCLRYAQTFPSIFRQKMSMEEEYLINESFNLIGQFDGLPDFARLNGIRCGFHSKTRNKSIVSFDRNPLDNDFFGRCFSAISHEQVIELHYHTFKEPDNVKSVVLHPYILKEYNRRWYLLAAANDTNKILTFALDRMDDIVTLPAEKYRPCPEDIMERFEDIIGVTYNPDAHIEKIIFWVEDSEVGYIETKPLHDSQKHFRNAKEDELRAKYPKLKGGAFFCIQCMVNYELVRELMMHGGSLLVVEPSTICQKVQDMINGMSENYQRL